MADIREIIAEIDSVRHGEDRPWIYNEDGTLNEDVFVIDAKKILEAFLDADDIVIDDKIPFDVEDVRKEAEKSKELLESLKTVGNILDFINGDDHSTFIDLDNIVLDGDDPYAELEDVSRDTKVLKIALEGYSDHIINPILSREKDEDTFLFDIIDDNSNEVAYEQTLEGFEDTLKEIYCFDTERIYEKADIDNTYNYNCNISNDMCWGEFESEEYGKVAMLKFHIIGDARGNYTDEIFVKLGDYNSLLELLYEEFDDVVRRQEYIEVDGEEYSVEIDAFRSDLEIYDSENNSFSCYETERDSIIEAIKDEREQERE